MLQKSIVRKSYEGVDIMFRRFREARENSRQERVAIADAARAEGIAEGIAEGRAIGRAEAQRVWQAWYLRQVEAQEKGQPFTEPPPNLNGDTDEA